MAESKVLAVHIMGFELIDESKARPLGYSSTPYETNDGRAVYALSALQLDHVINQVAKYNAALAAPCAPDKPSKYSMNTDLLVTPAPFPDFGKPKFKVINPEEAKHADKWGIVITNYETAPFNGYVFPMKYADNPNTLIIEDDQNNKQKVTLSSVCSVWVVYTSADHVINKDVIIERLCEIIAKHQGL